MSATYRACRGSASEGKPGRLRLAVLLALAATGAGTAQTVPYEAPQRFGVGAGIGQTGLQRGSVFQPRLESAIQYVSNMNLASDGQPQVDTAGLELAPGLYASYSSDSFIGAIDYSLIGRLWEDSDYNDVTQRLAANGEWFAVPGWFGVRGNASYADGIIDPAFGLNYGGLGIFGPSNLMEVASASLNPILSHDFNDFLFVVQYRYGRTWYLDEGKGQGPTRPGFVSNRDSEDQYANVSFGRGPEAGRLAAQVYYDWQHSEFDRAIPYEYERTGISLSYLLGREFSLVGDYGWESDLTESTTQGGLDSEFWSAGFRWVPSDRTSLEVRYGDRFFGESYSFSLSHRARLLEISASYSEQPQVQTRELSLGDFDPGDLPPDVPGFDFGRLNGSPYVASDGQLSVALVGSRTRVYARGYYNQRDYLRDLFRDETGRGGSIGATRQLASNLSTDFSIAYSEYDRSQLGLQSGVDVGGLKDFDTRATLRVNRSTSPKLTISGEAGYLSRSGASDYDGWWLGLRARWSPYAAASGQ